MRAALGVPRGTCDGNERAPPPGIVRFTAVWGHLTPFLQDGSAPSVTGESFVLSAPFGHVYGARQLSGVRGGGGANDGFWPCFLKMGGGEGAE